MDRCASGVENQAATLPGIIRDTLLEVFVLQLRFGFDSQEFPLFHIHDAHRIGNFFRAENVVRADENRPTCARSLMQNGQELVGSFRI